jgi:D-glycero-beta-D-manno-heptose-7-phosphate kinase
MENGRTKELLEQFKGKKVLVVGDILLDHYVSGVVERLNPEAPVPILRATDERVETGGAGNVAKNVAKLGAETSLIGVVGDDGDAEKTRKAALVEGYRAVLIKDSSRPTTRKTRHIVSGQQMIRVDFERDHDISEEIEKQVLDALMREIEQGVDAIIVSDYAKGVVTRALSETLLDVAGQRDIIVAGDIKPSRASYFVGATLVSPNMKEAHEYLGLNHLETKLSPEELAKMVYMKMCSNVYLTLGKDGMYIYSGGEEGKHVKQDHVVDVADESGAGDAAVSVLLLGLLAGATEEEAAKLANAAGALVVSKIGAVGVTGDEIKEMVEK